MDSGRISARYAKAAYEYAASKGEEKQLYGEMSTLADQFFSSDLLKRVLDDPTVTAENKKKILVTAGGITVSDSYERLLEVVLSHRRESYARSIALMYVEYYRIKQGMVICKLVTSEPASDDMKIRMGQLITRGNGKQVDFKTRTDKEIIGGFILKVDDYQLDASVKSQLYQLKKELMS